jgi:hypothetical protein
MKRNREPFDVSTLRFLWFVVAKRSDGSAESWGPFIKGATAKAVQTAARKGSYWYRATPEFESVTLYRAFVAHWEEIPNKNASDQG